MKRLLSMTLALVLLCAACASSSPAETSGEQAAKSEVSEPAEATDEGEPEGETTEPSEGEADAEAETVTTRFAWPEDLDGVVRVESERTIHVPGEPDNVEKKRSTFDVDVEQTKKGHLDVFFEHDSLAGTEVPEDEDAKKAYFLKRYKMLWMPAIRVSMQTGGITEVLNMDQLRAGHEAAMDQFAPEGEEGAKRFRAAMAGVSPDKVAMNRAAKRWNMWVAFWQGADLEIGASYEVTLQGGSKMVFSAVQMVPCEAEANAHDDVTFDENAPRDCVELLVEQALPEQALLGVMRPIFEALDEEGDPTFHAVDGTEWFSIICDPDTLIPYSAATLRRMSMLLTVDGKAGQASVEGTESMQFDWKNAPAPGG